MAVTFRTYNSAPLFGEDYLKLRGFLPEPDDCDYPFGRRDWMITHTYLDKSGLPKIGLREDGGKLVAAAAYDCGLGKAYPLIHPQYRRLTEEVILYAAAAFAKDGQCRVLIRDGDAETQDAAARNSFAATQGKERVSVLPIGLGKLNYSLPEGFSITSMADTYDLCKYGQVLWKGFNHEANGEGAFVFNDEKSAAWERELKRPNVNLNLKVAVVAPNGDFVSYCGMWQDSASQNALVEPVATDPAYRKMGLGRAAVLKAVRRCGQLGAQRAFVCSSQQFYYSIGFRPYATSTFWERSAAPM